MIEPTATTSRRDEPRKSLRERKLTPKMQELKQQEISQNESKFIKLYENWKEQVKATRTKLKSECSDQDLSDLMDSVEEMETQVKNVYELIRSQSVSSTEIRRKMDSCTAVTADIMGLMKVRMSEVGQEEFDVKAENARIHMVLDKEYAQSIFSPTSSTRSHRSSCSSAHQSITAKRAECAAQLAAKQAEMEMEEAIATQRLELKRLENQRDLQVIAAKLKVYSEADSDESCNNSRAASIEVANCPLFSKEIKKEQACKTDNEKQTNHTIGEASVVQALHDTMVLSRLPTPEPSVFSGDPLKFLEWRTSFKALIERRCKNPADKLFYLQKYVSGEAQSVLEGSFYRKDDEAYDQAWEALNARYGHPFVIQRAFREKLNNWPKIGSRESVKLRQFSDFLTACSNAMPHIKGLQVLNDCEENQKMLQKLPDWLTSRWNRHVTMQLKRLEEYPTFKDFANFVAQEAEIACNPVTSFHALKLSEEKPSREVKRSKANAFITNVTHQINQKWCQKRTVSGEVTQLILTDPIKSMLFLQAQIQSFADLWGKPLHPQMPNVHHGDGGSTSMIVPVWISSTSTPERETLVYALLDTQSSKHLRGSRGILPPAYTRDFIPLERSHIPTPETARRWSHLNEIAHEIPMLLNCKVGLLIGYDCSRALAPRQVITGGEEEPYAVRTDLGWSIVGSSPRIAKSTEVTGLCHRVSVKEIPILTPASVIRALESDFRDTSPKERSISQDDIQFTQLLNEKIHQNSEGHLEMPLPFKTRPQLPENKQLALVRLKRLKGRFEKDPKFKDDYVKFMEGVFKDGDAERAEHQPKAGNVWVGGRLKNASLPLDSKHPAVLPRDSVVTRLIVDYCHKKTQHQDGDGLIKSHWISLQSGCGQGIFIIDFPLNNIHYVISLENLEDSLDLSKLNFIVKAYIRELQMFKGYGSDKCSIMEWIEQMEPIRQLQKRSLARYGRRAPASSRLPRCFSSHTLSETPNLASIGTTFKLLFWHSSFGRANNSSDWKWIVLKPEANAD
ncbi:hypothetical protein QQF64_018597 [Cirrhinus molitorella]|uniref:Uncharacterized protein n=1 Tax=Cirrhinus molitorella TaxID=172907 RepID=A0ABR3LFH5_9TELE